MKDDTLLARWLAGELNSEELKTLQDHPRYDSFVKIRDNFDRLQNPEFKSEELLNDILRQEKKPIRTIPLYKRYWTTAAASIVVFLGLAYFFTMPEKHATPNGATLAFTLPDQSEVILNAGSKATYKDWNWENNRQVHLEGEAYFKVAKGKKFSVETALGTVTVMGTQFNVRVRKERLDVVCFEGKVRVTFNGKETILTPQQAVSIDNEIVNPQIKTVTVEDPQWLHKELSFSDEKLGGVIAEIERQYDVTIQTGHTSSQLFSGPIPGNDLDAALKSIAISYHLEVTKKANIIVLKPIQIEK